MERLLDRESVVVKNGLHFYIMVFEGGVVWTLLVKQYVECFIVLIYSMLKK